MVVLGCFEIWLLVGYGDEEEPPLLFKKSQPHFRRFWMEERCFVRMLVAVIMGFDISFQIQ